MNTTPNETFKNLSPEDERVLAFHCFLNILRGDQDMGTPEKIDHCVEKMLALSKEEIKMAEDRLLQLGLIAKSGAVN